MKAKVAANRMIYYDLLRIIAAFSVVVLHCAASYWYRLDFESRQWWIANAYDALSRFGVPIFVMLSGALWLSDTRELNLKKLYLHNILRMAVIYTLWSCAYGLMDSYLRGLLWTDWKEILREMLYGRYHLWFLPMIIGLYMLLPILRRWVLNAPKRELEYFLVLFFVLKVLAETIKSVSLMDELHYLLSVIQIDMACGYMGYFVMGYYIAQYGIPPKFHKWIYMGVVPACVLNVTLSSYLTRRYQGVSTQIYDSYGLFTFWIVTALFLFFTDVCSKYSYGPGLASALREVSADTLGVYVMHVGLLEIMGRHGFYDRLSAAEGVVVYAVAVFLICCAAAALLRRIPLVGRFLC